MHTFPNSPRCSEAAGALQRREKMASATRFIQALRNWASGVRGAGRQGRAGMGVGGCELRAPGTRSFTLSCTLGLKA